MLRGILCAFEDREWKLIARCVPKGNGTDRVNSRNMAPHYITVVRITRAILLTILQSFDSILVRNLMLGRTLASKSRLLSYTRVSRSSSCHSNTTTNPSRHRPLQSQLQVPSSSSSSCPHHLLFLPLIHHRNPKCAAKNTKHTPAAAAAASSS